MKLIRKQPDPRFFYKTFLELGGTNFCSILACDSKSMEYLLHDRNQIYFSEKYPIIYRNKLLKKDGKKYYYTNAIENALKNQQINSVGLLIKYIVKYQNTFVSSFLFLRNLPTLLQRGVDLHDLLASRIFDWTFDFDSWPGNHNDDQECIRAYNGSIFDIRESYSKIFPDIIPLQDQKQELKELGVFDKQKIYKIKYSINLLAQIDMHIIENKDKKFAVNEGVSLMSLAGESEQLSIFDTESLNQVIQFKWINYGKSHHVFGCIMHFLYTLLLVVYTKNAIMEESED